MRGRAAVEEGRRWKVEEVVAKVTDGKGHGSGACIGWDHESGEALIVTAKHVVREAGRPLAVRFPSGEEFRAEVLAEAASDDVALLTIKAASQPPHTAVGCVAQGVNVWKVGYPGERNGELTTTYGPVLNRSDYSLFFRARVRPGDSGGGVFDQTGRLVGVAIGCAKADPSVAVAVDGAAVAQLVEKSCWPKCRRQPGKPTQSSRPELPPLGSQPPPATQPPAGVDYDRVAEKVIEKLRPSLADLKGPKGDPGEPGKNGRDGRNGKDADAETVAGLEKRLAIAEAELKALKSQGPTVINNQAPARRVRVEAVTPK